MKIDAAKGRRFRIYRTNAAKELKGTGSGSDGPVIPPVPHLNAVDFSLDGANHIYTPGRGMCQNRQPSSLVYPVHQFLHGGKAHAAPDSITQNVDNAPLKGKFESWNDEKRLV